MIQGERRTYYRAASPQNAVKTPFAPIREIRGKNPPQKISTISSENGRAFC
jgi:hypothetical protein